MREYLLKAADGSGGLPLHHSRLAEAFIPVGWKAEPCEGWGNFRMRVEGVEVSFSDEDPGWQVAIEGDLQPDRADALLQTLAKQVESITGAAVGVVLITP